MYHEKYARDYTLDDGNRHTERMELLKLNLSAVMEWTEPLIVQADAIPAVFRIIMEAKEGSEAVLCWDWSSIIQLSGDNGPEAIVPLPEPVWIYFNKATEPGHGADVPGRKLEPGTYLFTQTNAPDLLDVPALTDWMAGKIEWFAREAWWTGSTATGPLFVRLVREDSKTAVQIIRQAQ